MSPADQASLTIAASALALMAAFLALLWWFITANAADSYTDQRRRDRAFWAALRKQKHTR